MAEDKQMEPEQKKGADRVLSFGNVPTVDLQQVEPRPEAIALIPESVALQYNVLPLYLEDDILTVVADYPDDLQLMDTLSRITSRKIKMVSPLRGNLRDAVTSSYSMGMGDEIEESIMDIITPMHDSVAAEAEEVAELAQAATDAPVVKAVDKILTQAVKERASDIHIAPEEKCLKVRYRIDGVLHDSVTLPLEIQSAILTRLKILSNMNIAERRRPQDGSFSGNFGGKMIDFRVATIGTNWASPA